MNTPGGGQGHGSRGASVGHLLAEGRRYLGLGRLLFAEQSFRAALAVDSTCTAAIEGLAQVEEARDSGEVDVDADDEFGDDATVVDSRIFADQGDAGEVPRPFAPSPDAPPAPPSVVVASMEQPPELRRPIEPAAMPMQAPGPGQAPQPSLPPPPLGPRAAPIPRHHPVGIAESFPPGTFASPKQGPRIVHIELPILVGAGVGVALFGLLIGYFLFG